METKDLLIKRIHALPAELIEEIYDFVCFLEAKRVKGSVETALLSESSLRKDWLSPEDEAAWKDL